MSKCARLTDRGVIRITGDDAEKFLQGLVTSDVAAAPVYTALLTPQGKILFDFFLLRDTCGFLADCAREAAGELLKRLTFYKLRAAVELSDLSPGKAVWAVWDGPLPEADDIIGYADPRLPELGHRLIADAATGADDWQMTDMGEDVYHARRVKLGVPEGVRDFALGDTFPHEADLDQIGGVDFSKGCFVGQEVVSRMQHRGTARKRIVPVEAASPLPGPGTEVMAEGTPLGTLGSVAGNIGLALLRLDRAEKAMAQGTPIEAGGVAIRLHRPDWASFEVPTVPDEDAA